MKIKELYEDERFSYKLTHEAWDALMETGSFHNNNYSFYRVANKSKSHQIVVMTNADETLIGLVHINIERKEDEPSCQYGAQKENE